MSAITHRTRTPLRVVSRPKRAARKRNLTELFIKKVKPENSRFLVWDTKQHGLALQVEPTGMRAWKCIYSFHGRPRWLNIGKTNAIGLADARTLAAEAMLAVAKGKDPAAEKKAERGAGTFAELAARWQQQELAAGRCARAPLCVAALGKAASGDYRASRCESADAKH
jgi:hypothetical protein